LASPSESGNAGIRQSLSDAICTETTVSGPQFENAKTLADYFPETQLDLGDELQREADPLYF